MLSNEILKITKLLKKSDLEDALWEAYLSMTDLEQAIKDSMKLNKDKKIQKLLKDNNELLKKMNKNFKNTNMWFD